MLNYLSKCVSLTLLGFEMFINFYTLGDKLRHTKSLKRQERCTVKSFFMPKNKKIKKRPEKF